jgi:purine-binding chemotaxis protein CheW
MSTQALATTVSYDLDAPVEAEQQYVTLRVNGQLFGISVMDVCDILRPMKVTPVPLAPSEIAGSMNLRGRIVTVINMRTRLRLPPKENPEQVMFVVVEHDKELFSLIVDSVGDVMSLPKRGLEKTPSNMQAEWRGLCQGVYKLEKELLLIVDITTILKL